MRLFSTEEKPAVTPVKPLNPKATPAAGFKVRAKRGQELISFRPKGHSKLTGGTINYNFELERQNNEKTKVRFVIGCVILSAIPFGLFVKNAEENFRKTDIKKAAERRRIRLDKEHGIDRDLHRSTFKKLDEIYRVSEKEEI